MWFFTQHSAHFDMWTNTLVIFYSCDKQSSEEPVIPDYFYDIWQTPLSSTTYVYLIYTSEQSRVAHGTSGGSSAVNS